MVNLMLIGAVNVYLFKDYFGAATALSMVGLVQAGTVFIMAPFIQKLVKKFGKKEVASIGILVAGIAYLIFIPATKPKCNTIYWSPSCCYAWCMVYLTL